MSFKDVTAIVITCAAGLVCQAQDTRGKIFGRALDPAAAAIPGVRVTIINTDTNISTPLVSNETGYYEGNLLLPGNYRVTAEHPGFKKVARDGITLVAGQQIQLDLRLEVGDIAESISVTAEAPLIDTGTVSAGRVLESREIKDLPVTGANSFVFAKLVPGIQSAEATSRYTNGNLHAHAFASNFGLPGRVGGNDYSIDGTPNDGVGRTMGHIPSTDEVAEIRVETANFDASMGKTVGVAVLMTTKSGGNQLHGSAREMHFQRRWQALKFFEKQLQSQGKLPPIPGVHEHNYGATLSGPVYIPRLIDGRNKLFFFFSYNGDRFADTGIKNRTVPTMLQRQGDFSELLAVDARRYQIYDPLSVRPDPARPTHFVRDPFAGNIIPKARQVNPTVNFYTGVLPTPNNNPIDPRREAIDNWAATPFWPQVIWAISNRVDYQRSDKHRFFFRWNAEKTKKDNNEGWLKGELDKNWDIRDNIGGTADWVWTIGARSVLDIAASINEHLRAAPAPNLVKFKPSDVGLPAYLDAKAGNLAQAPTMNWDGYSAIGRTVSDPAYYRTYAFKAAFSHIRGSHTIKSGFEARQQWKSGGNRGNASGTFSFTNAYTRREDDTFTPAGSLGHSWAAFLMGFPTSASIDTNATFVATNPYYAWYAQETWRVSRKLTLNVGGRVEVELGPVERFNRMITTFDSSIKLPITDAAQAAYARSPIPERPASTFAVLGGSNFAGVNGASRKQWNNRVNFMPRAAASYQLNSRTVLRGGYGLYYDTWSVLNESQDQYGFSRATSTVFTTNFGQTWLVGDPKAGISAMTDPFPIRADGTRFDVPLGAALGAMARAGRGFTFNAMDRPAPRQQRWRAGVQRQIGSTMMVDIAYVGLRTDRTYVTQRLNPLPAQYFATGLVRDSAGATRMSDNVANPFNIANFAALQTTNPVTYRDMASLGFFTSGTIARNQLIRDFPHMGNLSSPRPVGVVKSHSLEVAFTRRFAKGFNLNAAYAAVRARDKDFFANEFDSEPTWRLSNSSRPQRFTATGLWEVPFGKGRPFLKKGWAGSLAGGWELALTYECQPGALLTFGNLFYYGNMATLSEDLRKGVRTYDRWFNTENFNRVAGNAPTAYHVRVFPSRVDGVRGQSLNFWNGNLGRQFTFKERIRLQLRAELLNVFNRSFLADPSVDPLSTNFARITADGPGFNRWIQIQGRITF